jgi:NAD(P)-dependent dehydrogenase (short-subunit alcohol dehydrogenase family)
MRLHINSKASLERASKTLAEAWEKHKFLRVSVACGLDRSATQNSLSHCWHAQIARETGDTPNDVHCFCKLEFGVPILRMESEDFARSAEYLIDPLPYEQQLEAMRWLPVTRLLSVQGMRLYLTNMQHYYGRNGIALTGLENQQ